MFSTENELARAHKRNRVKTASREGIETTRERPKPTFYDNTDKERVGIYARVSTCMSQQTLSYEMQQKYYSDMVAMRPNWTLERIYADEGVTGTSTKKRGEFNKMIQSCREGKIDLIITKSVSRFSRNIEDVVKIVRSLAAQNPPVAVYFENEAIYSLNRNDDTRLAQAAINAQEESRIKSTAMESSIVMRFSSGMFLTPPLLGFDNDENGDLIVNEDEASTVRLIFFMYLCGESTAEIAKRLTELGRRTKRGETKWSAGTVYRQLVNERHCGAVLARKTHTPDYLDHLAKKNRTYADGTTDKKQYFKKDHHEAIISPSDFAAVQKMIANAKYGNQSCLPQLQVTVGGNLHGFVSINPHWAAFSAEDYVSASQSAGENRAKKSPSEIIAKRGDIDLRGAEVLCGENFADAHAPYVTLDRDKLRFSSACVRKFADANFIELLIHPLKKQLAIRPCEKEHKNAIRWAEFSDGKFCGRDIACSAFIHTLYSLLDRNPGTKYKLRCSVHKTSMGMFAIFDTRKTRKDFYTHISKQKKRVKLSARTAMFNANPDISPTPEADRLASIAQITEAIRGN